MGRKEFETVVAQASRESLVRYTNEVSSSIAATNGYEEILVYAGQNQVGKIVGMMISAPIINASATGNHEFYVSYNVPNSVLGISQNMDLLHGVSAGTSPIQYQNGYWYVANVTKEPTDLTAQGLNVKGAEFDSNVAFRMLYQNLSNTIQTGTRKYYLTYTQREVRA